MENDICQEIEDNEIQWKFQEIIQLLRNFKEHIFDFQQIANKMKGSTESNTRPKNFYTAQNCESAFRKLLEISKEKPFYVDFFKTIPYSEQLHGFKLLEQYEDYNKKIKEFVDKTLLSDKFKNMLVALEKDELSPETAEKMLKFCSSFPSLVRMATGIDEYDKIMEKKSIFESLMPERDKIARFQDLQSSLNTKLAEIKIKKEAENQAALIASAAPKLPTTPSQPSPVLPSSAPSTETKPSSKSSPLNKAVVPSKKSRPPSTTPVSKSRSKTPTKSSVSETPITKKKKPQTQQSGGGLKFSTMKHITPAGEPEVKQLKRRSSVSSKKSKREHREITPTTSEAGTQTYLSLLGTYDDPKLPPLIEKCKNPATNKSNRKTRNVLVQTGKIHLNFVNDMDTLQWFDDGEVLNEMTLHLAKSCLRSNTDFNLDKPIKCNMNLKYNNLTNPSTEILKKHPLYDLLMELKEADVDGRFTYPVKIEVPEYPEWIKRPMDLLTIEDLMIEGKVKDIDDLEFYCSLTCANAMAYGMIPLEAESYSDRIAEIFNKYHMKKRK